MGSTSHLTPLRFAEDLRAYLWEQIEPLGADRSGRWLTAATNNARSREYWRKVIAGQQAMTTNDIEVVAALFDQTPYEFVHTVRQWVTPAGEVIEVRFPQHDVPAPVEDERRVAQKKSRDPGGDEGDF